MTKSSELDYSTIRRRKKSLAVGKEEEISHQLPGSQSAGVSHVGVSKSMFDIPAEMSAVLDSATTHRVWTSGMWRRGGGGRRCVWAHVRGKQRGGGGERTLFWEMRTESNLDQLITP